MSGFQRSTESAGHGPFFRQARELIEQICAGKTDHVDRSLAAVKMPPELNGPDRVVAAAALQSPDICLIDAADPFRAATAVTAAAVAAGETVLLATAGRGPAERLTQVLRGVPGVRFCSVGVPHRQRRHAWWDPRRWLLGLFADLAAAAAVEPANAELMVGAEPPARGEWARIVIVEADSLSRSELIDRAGYGARWVLVGSVAARPQSAFAELWAVLDHECWRREGERLCCRLCRLSAVERERLKREPLADAPDIELRFHQPASGPPLVAEVVFPAETTLAAGKEFIGRMLEEWPVDVDPAGLSWTDGGDQLVAGIGGERQHAAVMVETARGVCELIAERPAGAVGLPWYTCGFRFDRSAGWDRDRAERWLRERSVGRLPARAVRAGA